jgi:hypothetical protein
VDWIHVPGDRQQWRILTNTVINYKRRGVSWLAERLLISEEGLYSMELVR